MWYYLFVCVYVSYNKILYKKNKINFNKYNSNIQIYWLILTRLVVFTTSLSTFG